MEPSWSCSSVSPLESTGKSDEICTFNILQDLKMLARPREVSTSHMEEAAVERDCSLGQFSDVQHEQCRLETPPEKGEKKW